ncbi:MAG TPA: TPM domain-containing protein [Flavisolibacter sp.]|nr:TPM domain-containing protein [Flavisolibacter sp.]
MRLPWQKKEEFFTEAEKQKLVAAIKQAEQNTSGEVRVFIESKCRFMDALDRAKEIFFRLEMDQTEERNATLIYVAVKDKQAAIFGDQGIHQKVGDQYWQSEVLKMLQRFKHEQLAEGISLAITDLGQALQHYFPYNKDTDKNELPDEIVFGR